MNLRVTRRGWFWILLLGTINAVGDLPNTHRALGSFTGSIMFLYVTWVAVRETARWIGSRVSSNVGVSSRSAARSLGRLVGRIR